MKKFNRWQPVLALMPAAWGVPCVSGDVATLQGAVCLFQNVLSVLTTIAGLAFGGMIILGGFQLIMAGGNKEAVGKAQKTFTHAIGGLVLVIASWFILKFIEHFTGLKVTRFEVPGA
ncbi:MAG: pilin [Patescibacteria group bacterium]